MSKIVMSESNIHRIPKGANVLKTGAVYINEANYTVFPTNGRKPYVSHKKLCIGKVCNEKSGYFYANDNYKAKCLNELPAPPEKSDSISVGVYAAIKDIDDKKAISSTLSNAGFDEEDINLMMDLSSYMIGQESAVFQHFPKWARRHGIYSSVIRSDSYISSFLHSLDMTRIGEFKALWAKKELDISQRIYLCYDSTNVNSQAEGVSLVEKGHAKDDDTLDQVNTEYVVRQQDGIPITYMQYPGSIVDVAEAERMIEYIGQFTSNKDVKITMVCDRGYISLDNIHTFRKMGLEYLLLLKSSWDIHKLVLSNHSHEVKDIYSRYIERHDKFGSSFAYKLSEDDDKDSFVHLIYDSKLAEAHRQILLHSISRKTKELQNAIDRKTLFTLENLKKYELFTLETEESGTIKAPKRGRGGKKQEQKAIAITSFSVNDDAVSRAFSQCGFTTLITSENITTEEALDAYAKRDSVEKVFQALKSSLGMDKIGVHSEASMQGKTLIWFIASILRSSISYSMKELRESTKNKKDYSTTSAITLLEAIECDKNISKKKYERRYALTASQKQVCSALGFAEDKIDEIISKL